MIGKLKLGIILMLVVIISISYTQAARQENYTAITSVMNIISNPPIHRDPENPENIAASIYAGYINFEFADTPIYYANVPLIINTTTPGQIDNLIADQVAAYGEKRWNITVSQVFMPNYIRIPT